MRTENEGECVDGVYVLIRLFTHSEKWWQGAVMSFNSLLIAARPFPPPVPLHPAQQKRTEPNPPFRGSPLGPLTSGFVLSWPERERGKDVVGVARIQACVHFKRLILKGFLGNEEGFLGEGAK